LKILILKNADPSFVAYSEILNQQGHEAEIIDKLEPLESIKNRVETFKPDFILHNNIDIFSTTQRPDGKEVEEYFSKCGIPTVVWEYEAPYFQGGPELMLRWKHGEYMKNFLFLSLDSFWVEKFNAAGISCYFLPFGVDDRLKEFRGDAKYSNHFRHDVTYIGTAIQKPDTDIVGNGSEGILNYFISYWRREFLSVLYHSCGSNNSLVPYIQELDQKLLPSILDLFRADIHDVREFQSRMYAMFQKYFDENLNAFGPDGSYIRIWLECRCIIIYSYFQVASRLHGLKEKGLRIYGEGQWNQILPEYGYPTRRLNYPEMYAAFQNSKIIFCFTKKLFVGNVHERVFHILGAGGFQPVQPGPAGRRVLECSRSHDLLRISTR
jgi:spore maturation protein CgeB